MANSSDWITALLERPVDEEAGPKSLDWLPDFSETETRGFVENLPFDRPVREPEVPSDWERQAAPDLVPRDLNGTGTGDALEDILRKALAETEEAEPSLSVEPQPEPEPEAPSQPQPDPIAEAFARGEVAGREAAQVEYQEQAERKVRLRQTFRALDQAAMDALAADLAQTVAALCAKSLADYIPAPDALKRRCLEAAQRLGGGAGQSTLYLHPDDLLVIDKEGLGDWTIIGDPGVERGGLRLEAQDGSVSDSPSDWRRAIAAAIKG